MVLPTSVPGPRSLGSVAPPRFAGTMATRTAAPGRAAPDGRGVPSETGRGPTSGLPAYLARGFLLSWAWPALTAWTGGHAAVLSASPTGLTLPTSH
jgi:hypothetical protein